MRILFLDLDTLRPDHLGCYGYHRNTSPNIDRICAEGVRFDNYYCSDAPCLPSRTALMTGRFGIHTGVVGHQGTPADVRHEGQSRGFRDSLGKTSLPAFLKSQGLYTCNIGGFAERHSSWTFYAGFREIHDTGKGGMESAEDVTPTALKWIEDNADKDNWYLHVNYWDAHTPYRAPESYGNPFADDPIDPWYTPELIEQHRKRVGAHTMQQLNGFSNYPYRDYPRAPSEIHTMDDLKAMIDGYDCGISYLDSHIGRLFSALEEKGVMDDLAVIISADHGESMGELGIYGEHATADASTCRIPLIIRWPGGNMNTVDKGFHYNLDLIPTLAELFGQKPLAPWEGRSYAPAVMHGTDCGRDYLVFGQGAHVSQRGVRWGDWLYMRTWHDGYYLFPDHMLYNLASDPRAQHDIADESPERCAEGQRILEEWTQRMMATMPEGYTEDPLMTVIQEGGPIHAGHNLEGYCKRLEETGRGWAVPELKERHPEEFTKDTAQK